MKRSAVNEIVPEEKEAIATLPKNGTKNGKSKPSEETDLTAILTSLQTMRDGDFSVRLPGTWIGLAGKIADTFNEIVAANQHMAEELKRVGQVVGKEGRTRERTRFHESRGAWGEMEVSVNTLVEDLLRPTTEVTRAIAAVAQGNLTQTVRLDVDGRPLEGEFLRSANHRQHDDSAAGRVHRGSHARGPRSGYRRQTRRSGAGAGRRRYVERPYRLREPDGQQPDWPGAQHRGGRNRRGQRRLVAQDHGGRARRNSAAKRSHQHDGGPAAIVRVGSDARGSRSRHRWKTRRTGGRARRGRNLEGS